MPTYDYGCTICGREVEVMHGVHGHGPASCEHCGGPMRKLLSAPTIHFKGSGWAKKDARDSARGGSGKKAAKSEAKTEPTPSPAEGAGDAGSSPAPSTPTPGA